MLLLQEQDLINLLKVYRFWSHQMYPKGQFRDTIGRVEKLCHSKRMGVALSVWRDEAHGVQRRDVDQDLSDDEGARSKKDQNNTVIDIDDDDDDDKATGSIGAGPSSPSRPPSSPSEPMDDEDIDVDAIIREMEEDREKEKQVQARKGIEHDGMQVDDDDQAIWDRMEADLARGNMLAATTAPAHRHGQNRGGGDDGHDGDDDEYMLEIMREMEVENSKRPMSCERRDETPPVEIAKTAPEVDDLEDLYV
jgi:replication fork protection complex subunit Csm3/Swi3